MRIMRAMRFLIPLLLVGALVVLVTSFLSARPSLQSAKKNVDVTWQPLAAGLGHRYLLLAAVDQKLHNVQGPTAQVVAELDHALSRWSHAQRNGSVREQVTDANSLEALGRRLAALPRLQSITDAKSAMTTYLNDRSYDGAKMFNAAVGKYHRDLQGPIRGPVASLLGYSEIPTYSAPTG
jgi:hypothetical protein